MELILGTEALRQELRAFNGIVDRGNTLLEMSNLLLEVANDKLFISGTDGDVSLRTELTNSDFEAVAPGALCIRADKLTDILGTLGAEVRSIRLKSEDKGWSQVMFGKSKFRISGVEPSLYPNVQFVKREETKAVNFPAGLLLQFLNSTSHAVSTQDTRYALTGANLKVAGGSAQMEAADGFKIARIKAPVTGDFHSLFPKKATAALKKILSEASPEVLVELAVEPANIFVSLGNKRFSFRKLTGEFPSIDKLLNVENDHSALLELYPLRAAVRRADLFADKTNHSSVTLTFRPGEVEIAARSFEVGGGHELIETKYDGPEVVMKISCSNLLSFFGSINSSEEPSGKVTLNVAFSAEKTRPTIWKVHREENVEIGYDYECLITKLR